MAPTQNWQPALPVYTHVKSSKADKRQILAQSWEVLDEAISFLPPGETPQVVFITRSLMSNDWLLPRVWKKHARVQKP